MANIDQAAETIWGYMLMHQTPKPAEAIFVLCSFDARVAEYATELFLKGYGEYLIFSGCMSRLFKDKYGKSEAEIFAGIAMKMGVPKQKIIIEDQAKNTGENVVLTAKLLKKKGQNFKSLLLVQKPYMERRTLATFKKLWPDHSTKATVSSPPIPYRYYFDKNNSKELVINTMVGDLQRIKVYSQNGYQTQQKIPTPVWDAYKLLVKAGYDKRLVDGGGIPL